MSPDSTLPDQTLPWVPLFTVRRSGRPELTIYGIVYAWAEDRALSANAGRSLVRLGDVRFPLWTRSLLMPFYLLTVYPTLKQAYPALTEKHFAAMAAASDARPTTTRQTALSPTTLREILELADIPENALQCPACKPPNATTPGETAPPMAPPCSGKHLAHVLYRKAKGLPLQDDAEPEPFPLLKTLLSYLLNRELSECTRDDCGMPNYALDAIEIAQLYHALLMPISQDMIRQAPEEAEDILAHWTEVAGMLQRSPDQPSAIRSALRDQAMISHEGGDGLLAAGIGACERFPDGLGFLMKLSAGDEPTHLETMVTALFTHWGFLAPAQADVASDSLLQTQFHFLPEPVVAGN
jgi:L-asparaginase II